MSTNTPNGAPEPERTPNQSEDGEYTSKHAREPEEKNRSPWLIVIAVLAIALVLVQLAIYALRNDSDGQQAEEQAVTGSEAPMEAPSQEKQGDESAAPTDGGFVDPEGEQEVSYEAAPGQFEGFEGMSMNVGGDIATVDPVQLTDTGALIPPSDVSRLGWYSASAVPGAEGAAGSSVITGHINYQGQGTGYAARFADMNLGDEFEIIIDGTPQTFRVSQAPYRLPKGSDFPPEVNDATGPNRLVLITCGGQFVGGALGYADNIITIAEPV